MDFETCPKCGGDSYHYEMEFCNDCGYDGQDPSYILDSELECQKIDMGVYDEEND